jgi:DNA mismatch repair protein MutL
MSLIQVLPDLVIDQIAAGEVLENPASAVKELLDNALDAGASEIRIEIERGGLQLIRIEDDGSGMGREDAMLCLRRHATSKIRSADDLKQLATMGFRGEALASIAAVASLEMKTSDGKICTQIADGKADTCARNRGTTIEIRSLFSKIPARLKFQKSPSACAAAVLKTVQSLALANPAVRFELFSNGKKTFGCQKSDWKKRAEEILGPFSFHVRAELDGMVAEGLLGLPEEAKANRSGQIVFVNRRPISSPMIARAVKDGYGTRIEESVYPTFLLFLTIPSSEVDVNVHPQKKEVRFREEGKVYHLITRAVTSAFAKQEPQIAPLPWDFKPASSAMPFVIQEELGHVPIALPIETKGRPLAVLGDFLLVEDNPWKWVDLRGAEARILFDEMEKSVLAKQALMWPLEVALAPSESAEETAEILSQVGIEARALGKWTLAIDALPAGMQTSHVSDFIRFFSAERSQRRLAASITRTCRASGRRYSLEEASLIWKLVGDRPFDPLGKKIWVSVTEEQLAELFE